jgi:hypothetical protein
MTPRQLDALLTRNHAVIARDEFMVAQLTSWVANTGFRSVEKPTKPTDFMPSEWAKARKIRAVVQQVRRRRLTKKRQIEIACGIRAMFPDLSKLRK